MAARQRVGAAHPAGDARKRTATAHSRRQRHQLFARFQIRLAVGAPQVAQLGEAAPVVNCREYVLHLATLGMGIVDVVRDHDRQAKLPGQGRRLGHEPVVVRQQVVLQLEEKRGRGDGILPGTAGGEEQGVPLGRVPRPFPIADPKAPGDLAFAAPGECHQTFRVLGQQRVAEMRHRLGPGQVRAADEPAEAAVAGRVARQQNEMRAALPLPDSTQILLHRVAAPGRRARAGRGRTGSPSPPGEAPLGEAPPAASSGSGAARA